MHLFFKNIFDILRISTILLFLFFLAISFTSTQVFAQAATPPPATSKCPDGSPTPLFGKPCPTSTTTKSTNQPAPNAQSQSTSSASTTGSGGDLNLLPAYKNLFDFMLKGIIQGFLLPLAPIVGLLAIVWGGYQYYFGSFTGKSDGMKAIQSGVIGIAIFSGYKIFIDVTSGSVTGLVPSLFANGGITAQPLIDFIRDTLLNNFLYALAGIMAVLAMVYGGYQYVTSPFNKEAGLKTIQNAAIGLSIILLASVAKNFITDTFKDNTISKDPFIKLAQQVVSNFLLPVSSVVTLLFVVYGSYQWITAQEPSQVKDAQKTLKNALIGLAIVIASFSITQLIVYVVSNLNLGK